MADEVTVRVIRTWEQKVSAGYKDTPDSLKEKVTEEFLDKTPPLEETRVILEDAESRYDTYQDWEKDNKVIEEE
jgi:hypothetical protein